MITYEQVASTLAVCLIGWKWYQEYRAAKKLFTDDVKEEVDLQRSIKKLGEDISSFDKKISSAVDKIERVEHDLNNERIKISSLEYQHTVRSGEIEDMRNSINKLYQVTQQQAIAFTKLETITENLVKSVTGIDEKQQAQSEKLAKINGRLEK